MSAGRGTCTADGRKTVEYVHFYIDCFLHPKVGLKKITLFCNYIENNSNPLTYIHNFDTLNFYIYFLCFLLYIEIGNV